MKKSDDELAVELIDALNEAGVAYSIDPRNGDLTFPDSENQVRGEKIVLEIYKA